MKNKRIMALLLALVMAFSVVPAFADAPVIDEGNTNAVTDGEGDSILKVDAAATQMTVTVPAVLPASVNKTGVVTVATGAEIWNDSYGPVKVTAIRVEALNDWTLVDEDHNFKADNPGTKNVLVYIQDEANDDAGNIALNGHWNVINGGGGRHPFTYNMKITAQKIAFQDLGLATVIFTIDWNETAGGAGGGGGSEPVTEQYIYITEENRTKFGYQGTENEDLVLADSYIEDGITYYAVGIGATAFQNTSLRSVVIPDGVTVIKNGAFSGCTSLEEVTVAHTVEIIEENAFNGCTALTSVTFEEDDGTCQLTTIGANAFNGCISLTTIDIKGPVTNVGAGAFRNCSNLSNISYSFDANITEIKADTYNGTALYNTYAVIPNSVTSIGQNAFSNCANIYQVEVPANIEKVAVEGICEATKMICWNSTTYYEWSTFYADFIAEHPLEEERNPGVNGFYDENGNWYKLYGELMYKNYIDANGYQINLQNGYVTADTYENNGYYQIVDEVVTLVPAAQVYDNTTFYDMTGNLHSTSDYTYTDKNGNTVNVNMTIGQVRTPMYKFGWYNEDGDIVVCSYNASTHVYDTPTGEIICYCGDHS